MAGAQAPSAIDLSDALRMLRELVAELCAASRVTTLLPRLGSRITAFGAFPSASDELTRIPLLMALCGPLAVFSEHTVRLAS